MNDLISIIVPVYNAEKYLDECVQSLVGQTYKNLEIILVDDGSKDKSPRICDAWATKDLRIKVIHKENSGVCDTRNKGLDIASGNFISFVDSDDVADLNYIKVMYQALEKHNDCGIVSCVATILSKSEEQQPFNENWVISETRYIEPYEYADRVLTMASAHTVWGKLFRKEVINQVRFRSIYASEELLLALDLYPYIEKNGIRVIELPDKLYRYRINPNSICHSDNYDFILTETKGREIILKEVEGKKPFVYDYYKKYLLLGVLSTIHIKLTDYSAEIPYYRFCRKLWENNDFYAKTVLNNKEFVLYLLLKYIPSMTYLFFRLKNGLCKIKTHI